MSQTNHQDVITLTDIAKRMPQLLKKLPHVVKGLVLANNTSKTKAMGLGWAFEKSVRANPYGVALLYQDLQLTYSQFNEWINQLAHYFLAQGLKKGDVIAVVIENRPELLALAVACAKIGVTLALVNSSQTGKVLTHSINLVKPKIVVFGEELLSSIEDIIGDLSVDPSHLHWLADRDTRKDAGQAPSGYKNLGELIKSYPQFNPPTTNTVFYGDGLFYIYTSGTTGLPKAVVFNHGRWQRQRHCKRKESQISQNSRCGPVNLLRLRLPDSARTLMTNSVQIRADRSRKCRADSCQFRPDYSEQSERRLPDCVRHHMVIGHRNRRLPRRPV